MTGQTLDKPIVPPHNLEAEQSVLGAILLDGSLVGPLSETLHVQDFYSTSHRRIYAGMVALVSGGGVIDNITLTAYLGEHGTLASIGGATYIAELVEKVAGTSNVRHHAALIVKAAELRRTREQLIKALSVIEAGADLEHVRVMLPDPAALDRGVPGDSAQLPVVTVAALCEEDESDSEQVWILDAMLAPGSLTGWIGKPKAGKSTFVYELVTKVALGQPFLGRAVRRCAVLILAVEEPKRDIRRRMRALGAEHIENIYILIGSLTPDENTYEQLRCMVDERGIGLIVVDTLNSFWSVNDENNAAEVTRAVKPLLSLARDSNVAVMVVHHARKSEGEHGDEIRGSGALFSLFDSAFILKRHTTDTQRRLTAISRWPETPPELILELRDCGYVAIGDPATAGRQAKLEKMAGVLTTEPRTAREVALAAGIASRVGYDLIDQLVRDGRAERLGSGRRGDPFRFVSCSIERGPA